MNSILIDGLGWTFVNFLWQGALIGAAAILVLAALRSAHPGARHTTACIALLACLVWPGADLAMRVVDAASEAAETTVYKSLRPSLGVPASNTTAHAAGAYMGPVTAMWLVGVLLLGLRSGLGLAWIARSAKGQAAPAWEQRTTQLARRMGIARSIRVRLAPGLDSPVTAGWRHPLILLPAPLAAGMSPTQLDALLAHELAHIRRHDYAINLVQTMVVTLLFFHPVAWWLSRRIHAERELLADELAAHTLGEPRALAEALAELDRQRHAGLYLMQAASGGELIGRIRALVKPQAAALKLHLVLPALVVAIAGVALTAQAASKATGQALSSDAVVDFLTCSKPVWPAAALAAHHTGTVTLKFKIDREGKAVDSKVVRSSGHDSLDQAALEGIGKCHFKPALLNGMPVVSSKQMQYVWTLE